jgi:lipid-A-disaccharide synthase
MISCGEASGDLYGAALARSLRASRPDVRLSAFGGPRLRAAGAELVGDYAGLSVTGLTEAVSVLRRSWAMLRAIRQAAARSKPDVFVAIDFPDFNLRLLPKIHALHIPIVYYVSPQLWAWRPGRIDVLRRYASKVLVIFPFEVPIYERAGIPVEFVGHPLVELIGPSRSRESCLREAGLDPAKRTVALLPGSRPNEVRLLLPVLEAASREIQTAQPDVQFLLARAPSLPDEIFRSLAVASPRIAVVIDRTDDVLEAADVVVTASGTATIQTAIHGKPMAIVYRLSPLTYAVGRRLVRLSSYGMVNLVAGRQIVPELIQDVCTPSSVAREVIDLLTNQARAELMRADLATVRAALGGPGASDRAARATLSAAGVT